MITLLALFSLLASATWGQTCLKKGKLKLRVGDFGVKCDSYENEEECNRSYQNITMTKKIHAVPCEYDTEDDLCGFDSNCAIRHDTIDWPDPTPKPTGSPTLHPTIDLKPFGECQWYRNRRMSGTFRETWLKIETPLACMKKCADHELCQYWSFYVVNEVEQCKLNWGDIFLDFEDFTAVSGARCEKEFADVNQVTQHGGECVAKVGTEFKTLPRIGLDSGKGIPKDELATTCQQQDKCLGYSVLGNLNIGYLHVPHGTTLNNGLKLISKGTGWAYHIFVSTNLESKDRTNNKCYVIHPFPQKPTTNMPTKSPVDAPTAPPTPPPTKAPKTRRPTKSGDKKKQRKVKITLRLKKKIKKTIENINDILNAILNTLKLKPTDVQGTPTVEYDEDTGKATVKIVTEDEVVAEKVEEQVAEEEFIPDVQQQLDDTTDTEIIIDDAEEETEIVDATPEPTSNPTAPPTGTCQKFISVPKDVVLVLDSSKSMYTQKGRSGAEEANWNTVLSDIGEVICIQQQGNNCAFTTQDKLGFVQFSKNRLTRMDVQGVDWWTTIKINDADMQRAAAGFETDTVRALWAAFDMLSAVPAENEKTVRQVVLITDGVPKCTRQRNQGDCSPCHTSNRGTTLFKQLQAQADVKLIFRGDRTTHDKKTIGEAYLQQDSIFGCLIDFDDDTKFTFIEDFKSADFVNALKGADVCEDHLS